MRNRPLFYIFSPLIAFGFLIISSSLFGSNPHVLDESGIINPFYEEKLNTTCLEFEKKWGVRIQIQTENTNTLDNFSELAEKNFIPWLNNLNNGKKGVLLFIGLKKGSTEGKVSIRVGMGLKDLLTESELNEALNKILEKNLADQDGEGLCEGVSLLQIQLAKNLEVFKTRTPLEPQNPTLSGWSAYLYGVLGTLAIGLLAFLYFRREKCPRCDYFLQVEIEKIREETPDEHGLRRKIFRCQKCGFVRKKKEILLHRFSPETNPPEKDSKPI